MRTFVTTAAIAAALFCPTAGLAAPILQMGDFIIPIDLDPPIVPISDYPLNERPDLALDGDVTTKYLNRGERNSGLILTPSTPSTIVQSMILSTANDAPERDPTSWKIWGTNDALVTPDNTSGPNSENWTLISEGLVALPTVRQTAGPVLSFGANTTGYNSYRVTFPTVRNFATANSMQLSEIGLYTSNDGTGTNVAIFPIDVRAILLDPIPTLSSSTPAAEIAANILDGVGPRPDLPSQSNHPAAEGPANVVDGTNNKYFNGGGNSAGFIVSPAVGASTVRSFQITTANDAVDRDPTSYELYGTNQAIASVNNSYGTAENWTLIGSGPLALPGADMRDTLGPIVPVANNASFTSYKMLFPTRVGPGGGMQIAEASFFSTSDGMGADILNPGDPVLAIDATTFTGLNTKYLNFGENNSGVIVTPNAGAKVVTSMQITTANDATVRDPASYEIYGTNDTITSTEHSQGNAENWTLISSGALSLPDARFTAGDVITFANTTSYKSYRIVFPTVKDETAANSMQIAGLQLFDNLAASNPDFDGDGDVDGRDFLTWQRGLGLTGQTNNDNGDADGNGIVNGDDLTAWKAAFNPSANIAAGSVPEPHSAALVLIALSAVAARRRATWRWEEW